MKSRYNKSHFLAISLHSRSGFEGASDMDTNWPTGLYPTLQIGLLQVDIGLLHGDRISLAGITQDDERRIRHIAEFGIYHGLTLVLLRLFATG